MGKSKNRPSKNRKIILAIVFLIIAIVMIISGIYLNYLTIPQKYYSLTLDKIINYIDSLGSYKITGINKNYSLTSSIKVSTENNNIKNSILSENTPNKQFISNINNLHTDFEIIRDFNNKKLFISLNSKILDEELLNTKYLVENSTEYYQVDGILPDYINNGNSNYFESLSEDTTDKDNIVYVLRTISKNLKKSIKDEYINVTKENVKINNKDTKLNKLSLELNDKSIKDILNKVIKELKNDTMSRRIISSYYENFDKYKINNEKEILNQQQNIIVNIYTSFLGKIEKYEIIYRDNNNERIFTYIVSTKEMSFIKDGIVKGKIIMQQDKSKKQFNIYDQYNKKQGKLVFDKMDKRTTLSLSLINKDKTIDLIYDSKLENVEKEKSFDNDINISYKVVSTDNNITMANIYINNKVTSKINIKQDTSNALFASSVTEEQKLQLNTKVNNIMEKLIN